MSRVIASRMEEGVDAERLQNHGILTVVASVESAVASYVALENACQTQLLAEAAGTIKPISHKVAHPTANPICGAHSGAFGFRPLWGRVLRASRDFQD